MTAAPDFRSLDPCVHCGFCLPACPTYLATGDEADSPRGRIVLMRALEHGEVPADDPALRQHLDACLGCRGCEPVCPAGVGYGRGLETARELLARARGLRPVTRLLLGVFARRWLWRPLFAASRRLRDLGMADRAAGAGRIGFGVGMIAATRPLHQAQARHRPAEPVRPAPSRGRVALFRGCVMDGLFGHVHQATRRTLELNGYTVIEVASQACCGALHEHAGDRPGAERLARQNLEAFGAPVDYVVSNSAGCGALLKEYGRLLGTDPAHRLGERVRDVTELLAAAGPRTAGALPIAVAYDAPCHLQHAQRVQDDPLTVLRAIPELRLHLLPDSDKCCGAAGLYSMIEPAMSRAVLQAKIQVIARADPRPDVVATGNPGCLMQIGAGLLAAGLPIRAVHPVELLDQAYAAAGMYPPERTAAG